MTKEEVEEGIPPELIDLMEMPPSTLDFLELHSVALLEQKSTDEDVQDIADRLLLLGRLPFFFLREKIEIYAWSTAPVYTTCIF